MAGTASGDHEAALAALADLDQTAGQLQALASAARRDAVVLTGQLVPAQDSR